MKLEIKITELESIKSLTFIAGGRFQSVSFRPTDGKQAIASQLRLLAENILRDPDFLPEKNHE
jgi:hypothetical protein